MTPSPRSPGERGHRSLPHTADIRIQAWGPTREDCLAEAVAALVDGFADPAGVRPERMAAVDLAADTDEDALLAVLDEVIYLLDTEDVLPVRVKLDRTPSGLRAHLSLAAVRDVDLGGAIPKAVSLSGLAIAAGGGSWCCTATVDV
jgi:SHS2 domain-containing protein